MLNILTISGKLGGLIKSQIYLHIFASIVLPFFNPTVYCSDKVRGSECAISSFISATKHINIKRII